MEADVRKRILLFLEEEKNTTVSAFAKRNGENQSKICRQIKFSTAISLNTILLLMDEYKELSAEWLLRGEGPMYITEKPALAEVTPVAPKGEITEKLVELLQVQLEDMRQEKNRLIEIISSKGNVTQSNINGSNVLSHE